MLEQILINCIFPSLFQSEKFKNILKINYPGEDALKDNDDEHWVYIRQVGYKLVWEFSREKETDWCNSLGVTRERDGNVLID